MRPPRCVAGAGVVLGLLQAATSTGSATAPVNVAELARCAAILGADQRLSCYDTLAGRALPPPPVASTVTPAAAAAAAGQATQASPENFGLMRHEQTAPGQTQEIQARVTQVTSDSAYNVYVTLDNGQSWTFNESDASLRAGEIVTIKRAALGSFLLVTANHHSYHVRRTQ